jgi:hypothetical protein
VPVHRRIAEVGRTPSDSEKRATSGDRVESLLGTSERVNGSLTTSVAQARKRRGPLAANGGRIIEARRSSSRERRPFDESNAVSLALRRGRDARSLLPAEDTLDRQSARLSRGPRGAGLGGLWTNARRSKKSEPARAARRRRQGCQRRSVFDFTRRKITPPRENRPVAEVRSAP